MASLPTGMSVTKTSIIPLVMVFVIYVIVHIIIAVFFKKSKEELDNIQDSNTDEYKELVKSVKIWGLLYKWFPAIAIVFILIGFYL